MWIGAGIGDLAINMMGHCLEGRNSLVPRFDWDAMEREFEFVREAGGNICFVMRGFFKWRREQWDHSMPCNTKAHKG